MTRPFDRAHYEALLEGLDVTVLRKSQLENEFTIGAEYYSQEFVQSLDKLRNSKADITRLADICRLITDGDHGSSEYVEDGVPYILSEAVKEGWIDKNAFRFITEQRHASLPRSVLKPGDVVVTKTGVYFGKSAVIPEEISEANTIAHVGKLSIKPQAINPYFLSTFLNSRFGYHQLRRRGIKATRPEIKLIEFQEIEVPLLTPQFQVRIEVAIRHALEIQHSSQTAAFEAKQTLLRILSLENWQPPESLTYIRRASETFAAERLDAEHYKQKFYAAKERLKKAGARGFLLLDELLTAITNGHTPLHHDLTVGEVPFLCAEHVTDFEVHYDSEKRILAEHHQGELSRTALRNDDVLLTIKGRVGNAALVENVPGAVNINQDVALLRFNGQLPIWFVLAYLNSFFGKLEVERMSTGGINPFLGLSNVRKLQIPVFDERRMEEVGDQTRAQVNKARATRHEARALLERAKRAVEVAIEDGESVALALLDSTGEF